MSPLNIGRVLCCCFSVQTIWYLFVFSISFVMFSLLHCFKILCITIVSNQPYLTACIQFRLQMLDHFAECIKQAKGVRQQAVQLNIFTAVLSALKVIKPP